MVTDKESKVNVIADPEEASDDRGPLVEDEELDAVKSDIESKISGVGSSAEDVLAFLEADEDEDTVVESYSDSRVPLARDIRPMIAAWHEYKGAMSQVKTSYKLWKIEANELGGDGQQDQRRDGLVESASRIKRALDVIEGEIRDAFPKLKGVAFLTRSEIIVLPIWMHDLLGIQVDASKEEQLDAQEQLQKQLDGAKAVE